MRKTLLVASILLVARSGGTQERESCRAALAVASKPTVCVSTPFPVLTINRSDGHIHFYVTLRSNNAVKNPLEITISVSAAANPSGVRLTEGQQGIMKTVRIEPGNELKDIPIFFVKTGKNNGQSGQISYTLTAQVANSSRPGVEVVGIPIDIDVRTVP